MPPSYKEMQHILMEGLRLYHFPVAVTFLPDEAAIEDFCSRYEEVFAPANTVSFCQAEVAARMQGKTVLIRPEKVDCQPAKMNFGWKEITDKDVRAQRRYTRTIEQARRFLEDRPKLAPGACAAVAVGPLGDAAVPPSVVHFYCDPMQAYHLMVDYIAALDRHPLRMYHSTGSAACGSSVFSFQENTINLHTACPGSYSSGKTERGEVNVTIPGEHIGLVVDRLLERKEDTGDTSLTNPGDPFPGVDVCKNCPQIRFKQI